MITFFRSILTSKIGAGIALVFLVFIGFAFALGDVSNVSGGGVSGGNVARVGERQISTLDLRQRIQRTYEAAARERPGLTLQQYLSDGAVDRMIKETADIYALEQYARAHGIGIDKASIDAIIARNPAFAGVNGSFSEDILQQRLRTEGITADRLRGDLESENIVRQLVAPFGQIGLVPRGVALPYASLLLEERHGQATFVPSSRFAPTAAPTERQLSGYYRSQAARYTIPERRVIRYAILDEGKVGTLPLVTAAELQAEYTTSAAEFAARESRRFNQVIASSKAIADRIVASVRGGATLAAAATSADLSASPVDAASREQFAAGTSTQTAAAAFAAERGALVGPIQVPLGWVVLSVENVDSTPARTLAQVTPQLTERLMGRRRQEAMVDLYNSVQDALNGGAALAEVATDKGLVVNTTPALLANGTAPDQPAFRPEPLLQPIIAAAFQAVEGSSGQVITLQENRVFALVEVASIAAAAPPPLANVRAAVVSDWRQAQGARIARDRARAILAAVERGTALGAASTANGNPAPVQAIGGRRINLTNREQGVPPEIALLFSMAQGSAKTLELPGNVGWMVIRLDRVVRGDASTNQQLLQAVQGQFVNALGAEYVDILIAAARAEFPVVIDEAAVRTLRDQMAGRGNPSGN
ncbi:MAG: SurA N-terminal domain-containing protein [Pseudomonadota bacterium]